MKYNFGRIRLLVAAAAAAASISAVAAGPDLDRSTVRQVKGTLDSSAGQMLHLYDAVRNNPAVLPRTYDERQDSLIVCPVRWWASGFFPGSMWYLYEYTGREDIRLIAEELTERMSGEELRTDHHDVGFAVNCSFGNGYRLTHNESYRQKIITGAASLLERFDEKVGCIKSWNTRQWGYTVIIDNMMNLELLTVASHLSGDSRYVRAAESHADVTMRNHFRPDGSSYHVVGYDTETGKAVCHATHQGLSDESSWARGQAWALYGYVMMYRQTQRTGYLDMAVKIGNWLMNHPGMPEDKIPYWDFDAAGLPDAPRDASAGAIMASAFLELASMTDGEQSESFLRMAEAQLRSLCSKEYFAEQGTNGGFLLKHSTGFFARNREVDAPLAYADYYFLEAMVRYMRLESGRSITDNTGPVSDNEERELWISALDRIARPVLSALSQDRLKELMPVESTDNIAVRRNCTHLEALGRVAAGIAPWLALGEDDTREGRLRGEYIRLLAASVENAVDPESDDYMNFTKGKQPLVDAAFLAQGLLRVPAVAERLSPEGRRNLIAALQSTRQIKPGENNWLLFSAVIEAALKELSGEWEYWRIAYAFSRFDEWYSGDGLYGDGPEYHQDYYNSFVIQPMMMTLLDVCRKHGTPDASFAEKQNPRYSRYAAILERFISPEGTYPVVGRSMAYRFGAFHALSDAAFRNMLPAGLSPAGVRSALSAVIGRQIGADGTFDDFGWLRPGFCGHQPSIGEPYISTGSLYLCTFVFVALGLPEEDPFWSAPPEMWTSRKAWMGTDIRNDKFYRDSAK